MADKSLTEFAEAAEAALVANEEEDLDLATAEDILSMHITTGTKKGYMQTVASIETYFKVKFPEAVVPTGKNAVWRMQLPLSTTAVKSYLGSVSYNR